jgi:hypothetical protein
MKKNILTLCLSFLSFISFAQYSFDNIDDFGIIKRNWALVSADECNGIIDKKGNVILPPIYDFIESFGDYIVLPAIYDNIEIFDVYSKKLARIEHNGKYGFINRKCEIVVSTEGNF